MSCLWEPCGRHFNYKQVTMKKHGNTRMTEMNTIESATNPCVENMREQNITLACENMQRWTFSYYALKGSHVKPTAMAHL